jgi:hypothetical protein
MRIAIVGGVERGASNYQRLASEHLCEVELHGGHMHGRTGRALENMIQRADLVVIVIDVNSHLAAQQAKQLARKHGVRTVIARNFGVSGFAALLESLTAESSGVAMIA